MNQEIIKELVEIVGEDNVSTDHIDKITHSYDATEKKYLPDAIVYAGNTVEISKIVKIANKWKIPLVPRGAGSGLTGGSLPVQGGIVLVLTRMDRILEIDSENLVAHVEPGVVTAELQRRVEKVGLFYPPDPASKEFSTLGGMSPSAPAVPAVSSMELPRNMSWGLRLSRQPVPSLKRAGRH